MLLDENLSLRNFGDWRQSILEFADSLRAIDIDLSAFACLAALTLITGNAILLVCMGLSEKKSWPSGSFASLLLHWGRARLKLALNNCFANNYQEKYFTWEPFQRNRLKEIML